MIKNSNPMVPCITMGQLPCIGCKELFYPRAPLLCDTPTKEFYWCRDCLEKMPLPNKPEDVTS